MSRGERIRTVVALVGAVLVVTAAVLDLVGRPIEALLWIGWIVVALTLISSLVASRRRTTRGS